MESKRKKGRKRFACYVSSSFILPFFYRIASFLYGSAGAGVIGRFLSGYDKDEEALKQTPIGRIIGKCDVNTRILRPVRFAVAAQFDNSILCASARRFCDRLVSVPLSIYGLICLVFSFFSCGILIFRQMMSGDLQLLKNSEALSHLAVSVMILIIGVCLISSGKNLAEALCQSRLCHLLFFRMLGVRESSFLVYIQNPVAGRISLAVLFGILLGVSTIVIQPLWIIFGLFGCIVAFTVYKIPETGVIIALFGVPFLPTMALVGYLLYLTFCFLVKYFRGKRTLHIGLLDVCILLYMCILMLSGVLSASPRASLLSAMVFLCFMLGYFLVANLIRSGEWLTRSIGAVLLSCTAVALYGIYQNYFGVVETTWQDTSMFNDITGRVISTFDNPNVLAEYLIMCLPLPVALFLSAKKLSARLLSLFVTGIIGGCLVFTWSRGAWLGFMLALMLFLLVYSKKTIVFCLFGVLLVPFLPFVLPKSILNRFLSIGNLTDTSTSYRVNIWKGVVRMLKDRFLGGIGVGVDAFQRVYPKYSLNGIESAPHSHNLFLQILVETGIFGLLFFICFLIIYAKHNFYIFKTVSDSSKKVPMLAVFAGILAVLAQGMTDYIWYNYRIFLMFWLMIGLSVALGRTALSEGDSKSREEISEEAD